MNAGCKVEAAYRISLSGGKVEQDVRTKDRKHALSTRSAPSSDVPVHRSRCECVPYFDNTVILTQNRKDFLSFFFKPECDQGASASASSITLFDFQ